jgi:WD40 repeat protein
VYAAAFSQDDRTLAAVTQGGYIWLWDLHNPRSPRPLGTPIRVATDDARSLAISPDDRTLAIGLANSTVQLWDIQRLDNPTRIGSPVAGPDGIVHALAFNPGGSVLAGGAGAGQTWVWRVTDRRNLTPLAILHASTTETWAVRFAPDGHVLAAASGDIYLWDTDPQSAIRRICENTGDRINNTEWTKNIPDAPYQRICP